MDRRDFLTLFLSAAVACREQSREETPSGDLVGASDRIGHKLRENPPSTASRWETRDIVIVGAGIAGLSAGWRVRQKDFRDYVILELEPVAGGTSRSGSSKVSAFPWGAHYLPAPAPENRDLVQLLREMNIYDGDEIGEQFLCRDPEERVFFRGRWYEGLYLYAGATSEDLRQLQVFEQEVAKWVAWRDGRGRRAFTIPIAHGSDDAEVTALDRISMEQWLDERKFTSSRLRWFIEYGCRDDYGTLLRDTSAWAGLFYFASRVGKAGEESRPLITWPEGNGRLVAHLARGANVMTNCLAVNIVGTDVIVNRGEEIFGIHAKKVIFAGPQFVAGRVISAWRENPPPHLRQFTYGSWMVANITLRDRPISNGFPLAWDNVLYESPSLGYVVATHQRGVDHGPTVFTYYYPLTDPRGRERLLATSREQWAEVALTDLRVAHPNLRALTERIDVMRWGHAMVRPRPEFMWSEARRRASQPFGDVHFAHSDLSGLALFEEAFFHGLRAADEVLA